MQPSPGQYQPSEDFKEEIRIFTFIIGLTKIPIAHSTWLREQAPKEPHS